MQILNYNWDGPFLQNNTLEKIYNNVYCMCTEHLSTTYDGVIHRVSDIL